jgi:ribosomal small subunit protein bTHX
MGRGDKKSRQGKIRRGSYGNRRPKEKRVRHGKPTPAPAKKA